MWELNPSNFPVETDQILSSNKGNSTVMEACYQESKGKKLVALKKPIKQNMGKPSKKEFKAFAEFAAGPFFFFSDPSILCYDGVLQFEFLQMPLMEMSVRQHLKGKRVKTAENKKKTIVKGFGSMQEKTVTHVMECVLRGLKYLHYCNIVHGGLSTSNVLINEKGKEPWEVKLNDYNLSSLGIESVSHKERCPAPEELEGSARGDLFSCSFMFVEMLTGRDLKKKEQWERGREDVKSKYAKIWKAITCCEDYIHHDKLTADDVQGYISVKQTLTLTVASVEPATTYDPVKE